VLRKSQEAVERVILEGDLLNDVQKRVVMDYRKAVGGRLEDIVVRLGFATEEQLNQAVARATTVVVTPEIVYRPLLEAAPFKLLEGARVLPVVNEGETVLAAEDAELEPLLLEELWNYFERTLPVVQAEAGTVDATLRALASEQADSSISLPEVTLEQLVALLVHKGIVTAEDLAAMTGNAPEKAQASGA